MRGVLRAFHRAFSRILRLKVFHECDKCIDTFKKSMVVHSNAAGPCCCLDFFQSYYVSSTGFLNEFGHKNLFSVATELYSDV